MGISTVPARKPKEKSRWQIWGESIANKGVAWNDWAAGYVNSAVERTCAPYILTNRYGSRTILAFVQRF